MLNNVSNNIEKDISTYIDKVGKDELYKVGNTNIRNTILALKDEI